jgi:putative acetyltransferase
MLIIRHEQAADTAEIRALNKLAFESDEEAGIIDRLRENCEQLLSLVAVEDKRIVGHILFSPATITGDNGVTNGMGLAPMAVHPEFQRRGIGSQLVERGLAMLREQALPYVIVLGHPDYYPRFGFVPASRYGIRCQWEGVPDEAFMVLILNEKYHGRLAGIARYREEFSL